jgi:hypothetical protein
MNIERYNKKPLTMDMIKIVNNPLKNYEIIILSIKHNQKNIDEISKLGFKTKRDKKTVLNIEIANIKLRDNKKLYKKECKKKGVYIGS